MIQGIQGWVIKRIVDLNKPSTSLASNGGIISMDIENQAHSIVSMVMRGEFPFDISNFEVSGQALRQGGSLVYLTGAIDANVATVTLTRECYAIPGTLRVFVFLTDPITGAQVALVEVHFTVRQLTGSGQVVDPGVALPNLPQIQLIAEQTQAQLDAFQLVLDSFECGCEGGGGDGTQGPPGPPGPQGPAGPAGP